MGQCIKLQAGRILSIVLCLYLLVFLCGLERVAGAGEDNLNVSFKWSFGALVGEERSFQPVTRDMPLKSGDQLKMMVELQKECFVYLIHYSDGDGIKLLFPYKPQQFDTDYQLFKRYYIPEGDAWFQLDQDSGNEFFHLLASSERLRKLEELLIDYEKAESAKKPEIAGKILAEIRSVKRENKEFAAPAERPVAIGGAIRGMEFSRVGGRPDVAAIASNVLSTGFIARTFTIEHHQ
jgi:hypothetical protein